MYRCWGTQHKSPVPIYPLVLDKTNFPRILNPRGAKGATILTTRTRSRTWTLTSGLATRGLELLLTEWRPSSCTPGFSIKRSFPECWLAWPGAHRTLLEHTHSPVPELCQALPWCTAAWGTCHTSSVPIYPLGLDKTNFLRILNPRGAKGSTIPTTRTRSRAWTLTSKWATRVVRTTFNHMATPLVLYPGFSIKRIFPEYWPAGPGTPRTLLQYPHYPVPELCLALPWCTAAGGTRHKSPVPFYPLGLDKTNFPRILNPRGAKGATIPTTRTRSRSCTLTSGLRTWGQKYVLPYGDPPRLVPRVSR